MIGFSLMYTDTDVYCSVIMAHKSLFFTVNQFIWITLFGGPGV